MSELLNNLPPEDKLPESSLEKVAELVKNAWVAEQKLATAYLELKRSDPEAAEPVLQAILEYCEKMQKNASMRWTDQAAKYGLNIYDIKLEE